MRLADFIIIIHKNIRCFYCLQIVEFYDDLHRPIIHHHKNCLYHGLNKPFFERFDIDLRLNDDIFPSYFDVMRLEDGTYINFPKIKKYNCENVIERQTMFVCIICRMSNQSSSLINHKHFCMFADQTLPKISKYGVVTKQSFQGRLNSYAGKTLQWGYTAELLAAFGFVRTYYYYLCECGFSVVADNDSGRYINRRKLKGSRYIPYNEIMSDKRKLATEIRRKKLDERNLTNILLDHIIEKPKCKNLISNLGLSTLNGILAEIQELKIKN